MQAGIQLCPDVVQPLRVTGQSGGIAPRKAIIMKCCVCGRMKTDNGWEYAFLQADGNANFSHGFCPACYEAEIRKIKFQTAFAGLAAYR